MVITGTKALTGTRHKHLHLCDLHVFFVT